MTNLTAENKVVVRIFGEEYPITGSNDPAHISKIADFVDSRMEEIARQSRSQARDKVAILTALSLASELMEYSGELKNLNSDKNSSLDQLLSKLDIALADQ